MHLCHIFTTEKTRLPVGTSLTESPSEMFIMQFQCLLPRWEGRVNCRHVGVSVCVRGGVITSGETSLCKR
ncbi:hypothetical protein L210DRAFT_3577062 [Boletus edulis BED1]|uniref:Uncharacterized protein n=1 Tax=Boletus edulis BED1 TaxID=1328754 RepID=A0AAD4BCJ7_BOLED|nr:hypothetical protein L210DRAFT_3577062 [Boletus edulis BED1]